LYWQAERGEGEGIYSPPRGEDYLFHRWPALSQQKKKGGEEKEKEEVRTFWLVFFSKSGGIET